MPTKIRVLCSLLLLQCTLGQCTDSRIKRFTSFPTIPAELLALKNYGAVDFLSSPNNIESIEPNIPSAFPAASAPEVARENLLINSNPYAIGVTNYEDPGISISTPVNFEVARIIDQVIPQPPLILETPITLLNTPLEPFSINYPIETSYELSPYTFSFQNSLNPVVPNLYVEEAPILVTSPSIQAPAISNTVELNPLVSPISNTLIISPPVLNAVLEVPSSLFIAPAIEVPAIPQVVPPSIGPIVDVLSPMLHDVPVAIEPSVYLNSLAVPTQVAAVELPVVEKIRTYARPQLAIPTLSSESIASTIANIKAIFSSLPSFTPSSRVRNLGGIKNSELSASRGNGLFITSSSLKRPNGISIRSENTYQGPVSVSGVLPFLGTVGFSGSLPSSGYGTVSYRCGSGNVGMLSEAPNIILNSLYSRS